MDTRGFCCPAYRLDLNYVQHFQFKASVSIKCLMHLQTEGDCLHDALKLSNASVLSVKYDPEQDFLTVDITTDAYKTRSISLDLTRFNVCQLV